MLKNINFCWNFSLTPWDFVATDYLTSFIANTLIIKIIARPGISICLPISSHFSAPIHVTDNFDITYPSIFYFWTSHETATILTKLLLGQEFSLFRSQTGAFPTVHVPYLINIMNFISVLKQIVFNKFILNKEHGLDYNIYNWEKFLPPCGKCQ